MRKLSCLVIVAVALLVLAPVASADEGWATWYGPGFHGRVMANGRIYDQYDPTGTASNLYPFGTWLKVTNLANGRIVYVQVRDRGAFKHALDLSYAAFRLLDNPAKMWIRVRYEVVPGPPATPTPAAKPAPTASAERAQPASRSSRIEDSAGVVKHTVQPGDTLWRIALTYGVSVASIKAANSLADADLIETGQVLVVKGAAAAAPPKTTAATPKATAATPKREHVVAEGESLSGIAERYGTSTAELARANGLTDPNLVVVGQRLTIPGASGTAPQPARAARQYVVQPGDTLSDIAARNGVDANELARVNGLDDPNLLQPGETLRLP